MYRFFAERHQVDTVNNKAYITGEDVNHLKNVLRMKEGEEISLTVPGDGNEYRCAISGFMDDKVELDLLFVKECDVELPGRITVYQALPKADKMELIITKAVELGAARIVPVATSRAVVRLDETKAEKKVARWNAISEAAAKQSKRAYIPEVSRVLTMPEALADCAAFEHKIIPYELADPKSMEQTREAVRNIKPGSEVAVFIGPEGGFTKEEMGSAIQSGFTPVTLGHRILRTETASLVVLSWINFVLE